MNTRFNYSSCESCKKGGHQGIVPIGIESTNLADKRMPQPHQPSLCTNATPHRWTLTRMVAKRTLDSS